MLNYFSRKRRRLLLVAVLAIGMGGVLYQLLSETKGVYHILPTQIVLALEFNGLVKINQLAENTSDPAWKSILQTTLFKTCRKDAGLAENIFQHDPALLKALITRPLLAGFTIQDADSLHAVFAVDLGYMPDIPKVLNGPGARYKFFPANYKNQTLYTVHLNKQERVVMVQLGNILVFSRFSYLVEDALAQWAASGSWWAYRKHLKEFQPSAWLKMSVRPAAFGSQMTQKLQPSWRKILPLLQNNVECLSLAWDGAQTRAFAETKGFTGGMDAWGKTDRGAIFNILPDHTTLLAWAGFSNRSLFWGQFSDNADSDFKRYILPWIGDEAAFVLTEPHSQDMREDQFVVLAVQDSVKAVARLRAYGQTRGALHSEEYQTYEIFNFLNEAILTPMVGESDAFRNPVCAMVGRYVVFAGSRSALEIWIDKYIVNQTIANNTDFLQLNNHLTANSNGLLLCNTTYLPLLVSQLFGPESAVRNTGDIDLIHRAGMIGVELQAAPGNRLNISLFNQSQDNALAEAGILWKTPIGANAITRPFVIPSPEGHANILIQDKRNEIYCLQINGGVAWRRQIDAPILSEIKGIDFLGNNTTCYVFNTAERIWLLDGKGQDIEGFPLQLQSRATNGVTVVDFDNNLKFKYFVACENGNLYGYDQFGRPLPGWNPQSGVGALRHPLLHFQYDHKDYLAVLNDAGVLQVYGQSGALRFPAVQMKGRFLSPPQLDAGAKTPRIVCVNTSGIFFVCNLDGSSYSLKPGKSAAGPARGLLAPLAGDARYEYIVMQGPALSAGGNEGATFKTLFSKELSAPPDTLFEVSGQRLGLLDLNKRQIFLMDGRGNVHPDFPLAGTTPFSITNLFQKSGETVLVVGNGASVYAYKVR